MPVALNVLTNLRADFKNNPSYSKHYAILAKAQRTDVIPLSH